MNSQISECADGRNKPTRKGAGWGNESQVDESSGGVGWGASKKCPFASDIENDPSTPHLDRVQDDSHHASTTPR